MSEQPLNPKDYSVMWGLDPGMRDMFVATNDAGDTARCSSREFYEDAHYTKSLKKIKVWQTSREDIMEAVRNMPQKKTVSLETLERYVRFVVPLMDLLIDFHIQMPFRKLRFRRHAHTKKKIHALCSLLTEEAGERTIVGFGDWNNISAGIKRPRAPVQQFKRELRKHCKVVLIDEFRTSMLHSECRGVLHQQRSHRKCCHGVKRRVAVHSVLHCRSNGCNGMTEPRRICVRQHAHSSSVRASRPTQTAGILQRSPSIVFTGASSFGDEGGGGLQVMRPVVSGIFRRQWIARKLGH